MSTSSIRPLSPPRPPSASVTTTTISTNGGGGGGGGTSDSTAAAVTTTTTTGTSMLSQQAAAAAAAPPALPTTTQQAQIAQARTALVASLGNALDTELQTRAALLHGNEAAIARQTRDVEAALAGLRREDDKLQKVLNEGSRQVKELGDVQNWAERLERDFLVLEETLRLVEEGSGSESGSGRSWSGSESGSWSGSDGGGEEDEELEEEDSVDRLDRGKGKQTAADNANAGGQEETGPSSAVNEAQPTARGSGEIAASTSPGTASWFRKFAWRGSS